MNALDTAKYSILQLGSEDLDALRLWLAALDASSDSIVMESDTPTRKLDRHALELLAGFPGDGVAVVRVEAEPARSERG